MENAPVSSPCILVCAIEPVSGHCYGCGRSRDEIAGWMRMSESERQHLMASELPERVSKLERRPRRVTRRAKMRGEQARQRELPEPASGWGEPGEPSS